MQKADPQKELYRQRSIIRQTYGYQVVDKKQYKYLFSFLKTNKKTFLVVLILLAVQIFLEIMFFSLSHNVLDAATRPFYQRFSTYFLVGGIFTVVLYIFATYKSIYYERKFVLDLTNKVRRSIFSNIIKKEPSKVAATERLAVVSKISYHLSLFTLGLDNAGISAIRWLFYFSAMIVYIVVFNYSYLPYLLLILIGSVVSYIIAYFVSNNYVSREAASYSKIVDHIVHALYDFNLIKKLRLERESEQMLDAVVDVDTYYRIRRDIWIRYSSRVILIVIVTGAVLYSIVVNVYGLRINLTSSLLLKGILFIYLMRIMFLSIRAGIYTIPFKIGIALCVPKINFSMYTVRPDWVWNEITFISNKVKLFAESEYFEDFRMSFQRGKRYLFTAISPYAGKTSLAELLTGNLTFSRHSYLVRIDQERLSYNQWSDSFASKYLFSVYVSAYATVGEFLFRKKRQDISNDDIQALNAIITENKIFADFSLANKLLTNPLEDYAANFTTLFSFHVLFCLLHKPELIVIDNIWLDLNHSEINQLFKFLNSALPDSTIVVFARKPNDLISYEAIYEITNNKVQKINF